MHDRFGDLLGRAVALSGHDVSEILAAQRQTGQRFGQVALAWGLCRPEHVWQAWALQASIEGHVVDLQTLGIDAQAAAEIPRQLARRLRVVGVRRVDGALFIAAASMPDPIDVQALESATGRPLRFVTASEPQIDQAIETYYPVPAVLGLRSTCFAAAGAD